MVSDWQHASDSLGKWDKRELGPSSAEEENLRVFRGFCDRKVSVTICVTQRLNSPQALTDKTGQIVWSAQYDEFGSATISGNGGTSSTSSVECNLRFPGQYFDAETGLHYNFHRYYDPTLGRYITEDPIRDGLNWYAYAGSNPGNAIDPLGLESGLFRRMQTEPTGEIIQSKFYGPLPVYRMAPLSPHQSIHRYSRNSLPSASSYFFPEYANNIMNFTVATGILPLAITYEGLASMAEFLDYLNSLTEDIPIDGLTEQLDACGPFPPHWKINPQRLSAMLKSYDMAAKSGSIMSDPYRNMANYLWKHYNTRLRKAYDTK